jgi:hypothetical protein
MCSDFDQNNPYQSPVEVNAAEPPPLSHAEALAKLKVPAIWLRVTSAISSTWGVGALAVIWYVEGFAKQGSQSPGEQADVVGGFAIAIAMIVLYGLGSYSAHHVARGQIRNWIWVAIVGGLVPLSPCTMTVPFAFWLLHLMLRKDIRAALARHE